MCADIQQSPLRQNDDSVSNFSPVAVRESPVRKTPQRGNLTGNPRSVRDLAADLYNLVQKWNACHITGANVLAQISQLKLTALEGIPKDETHLYPEGLQSQCNMLEKVCKEMSDVVASMNNCTEKFKALAALEKYQKATSGEKLSDVNPPMFLTWPPERFGEVSDEIASCYSSELEVKQTVLEGVCHCKSRETLMFHVAAWAHQPTMINENAANLQLEALLLETGHR